MVITRVSYCERIQAMHLTGTYNRSREKRVQFFPGHNRRSEQLKTYTPNIIKTKGQTPPLKKKLGNDHAVHVVCRVLINCKTIYQLMVLGQLRERLKGDEIKRKQKQVCHTL